MVETMSLREARRVALAAQGFGGAKPPTRGPARIAAVLERLRLLQIDSVNVFERSHYLPMLARIGPYDRALLDRLVLQPGTPYVEYWAHEAAFVPKTDLGLFAFRRRFYAHRYAERLEAHRGLADLLLAELASRGPLAASEIEHSANVRSGPWWGWSDVKRTLELLFAQGTVVTAGRRGFERRYALPEQVLEEPMVDVPERDAVRELVRRAAVAHGVAALPDLADYYRLRIDQAATAARELEDAGELVPVQVEGWRRGAGPMPAWRAASALPPVRMRAAALLSPFDPVVWQRDRIERLFGFHYRISIYTPAAERVHGYYVLPALVGDRLAGRIDLKADRKAGVLLVQAAWIEPGAKGGPGAVAERLAPVVRDAARWQGLDAIAVAERGDLAAELAAALG
ncbi:crosslink repair DNA glycosylase YcaQ family protein [Amnibacterium sp. CER49]|uniref:winged helix-turn-helix domain-containing protein n=1 Tax=Amnibacterium sp. CER49 TaxID=3039161 RepID=UPI00244BF640|nr:crosslink repair DNA glycosylase YcaQ family protein [Amnibacterium sp. CER49]MDH2445387.1 crosslink repair DNA glycosylase YcaQ family protein [Amnibacterium sp. CER49]